MWYWCGDKMILCQGMLQESSKKMLKLSQECLEDVQKDWQKSEEDKYLISLSEDLLAIARVEESLSECVLRIDKIYKRYEEKITDYFELNTPPIPHTVLGISTFENLGRHEKQMPFERRQ